MREPCLMSIEAARTAKRECEQAILHAIERFEHQSGLSVRCVTQTHSETIGGKIETIGVDLDVRLE